MVDVAAIFDEVFGPGDQDQEVSKNRCVRCVGVSGRHKPLENHENPNTPAGDQRHTLKQGVSRTDEGCARVVVEKQEVTGKGTPTHRTHRKTSTPSRPVDPDAFEERAGIIEYDAGLPRQEAETLAAQEQGFVDASSLHRESVQRWATEIERLGKLTVVSPEGAEALKRAREFISDGWALQAARLGWDEIELFGICPRAPWQRLDRKGATFGGAVRAVTAEAVAYVGGLRRYRAQVNNDGGAVPIWELAQGNPSNGGEAA